MEDQQILKVFINDSIRGSIQEVKDSFTKQLSEMRDIMMDMVATKAPARINRREQALDVVRQGPVPETFRHKRASVEIGRFHGENPEAWIFQAERYFDFYKIEDDECHTSFFPRG